MLVAMNAVIRDLVRLDAFCGELIESNQLHSCPQRIVDHLGVTTMFDLCPKNIVIAPYEADLRYHHKFVPYV